MILRGSLFSVALLLSQHGWADWNYQTVDGAAGVPLNVVTVGDPSSPGILFIHGIGQSHYSFVRQLNSDLTEDFFLVAFDLRGHGASAKPWLAEDYRSDTWAEDVAAVIKATHLRRPVLVAWSFGTLVAMDYIRKFGVTDLKGLILTGALGALRPFRMPTVDDAAAAEFARLRELQLSSSLLDNIQASGGMVQLLTAKPVTEEERRLFEAVTLMLPKYARQAMTQRTFNNQDLLERLTLPLLLSLGEEDNPIQLEDGAAMAADHDNITLSAYENAGHSVFFEQPDRFNAELRRFAEYGHSPGK